MTVFGKKLVLACLLAVVPVSSVAQPAQTGDEARTAAYEEFRRLFADSRYADALPLAQRVVQLTENADPGHDELPVAYNNLGVVLLRVGEAEAAEAAFERALELLELRVGIVSRRLIAPLAGLGAARAARGHHALAADALQRALAISRRASGLFNIDQLELLESLIGSYVAVGNKVGVERERRYATQVVQQEYGFDDPRTIPNLILLAELYEGTYRYALARAQWQRIIEIAAREDSGRNAETIVGLLGVARCHRLQFVLDPESLQSVQPLANQQPIDPWTGRPNPLAAAVERPSTLPVRPNRDGEEAALQALKILDAAPDPPKRLLASTLVELGDWYVTTERVAAAIPHYSRAWPLLIETTESGELNPLATPRALLFRPPIAAIRHRDRTDVEVVETPIEFVLSVSATGEADNVRAVDSDAADFRASQIRRSLLRARFSPRFEDGVPAVTDDHRFTGLWYDLESASEPSLPDEPQAEDDKPVR